MLKSRKIKLVYVFALVFSIMAMSVGFAAFSASLNLASSANVKPNSENFGVKFSTSIDSVVEDEVTPSNITSGLSASNGMIDNTGSPKLTNLSVNFTSPGQYVEYSFYAYNSGEYNAYLNSVNFDGEKVCVGAAEISESLLNAACNSINMSVTVNDATYTETTPVTDHVLNKKTGEQIKLRIEYDSNGEVVDGNFKVEFPNLVLIYSTINDSTYVPEDSDFAKMKLLDVVKENAISDIDVDFGVAPTTGKYIMHSTEGNSYPIYYYRGAVENNNLKFAGFCWKIVRTTETGGIKLIYNGVPAGDGSCNNTGTASQLANTSAFNLNYNSPADVGYMYGTRYTAESRDLSDQTDAYIYGNDVVWDGTNYTLVDTMESSSWTTDSSNLSTRYHYTCFSTSNTCSSVYYIHYFGDSSTVYYLILTNGKNIEDAKEEMFANTTDSTIKTKIDNWYSTNMTGYTSKLEDTVWCNDREFYSGPLKSKDTDAETRYSYFDLLRKVISESYVPTFSCLNERDSFTVDGAIGNGKLTYPVGLLTADEIRLSGGTFFLGAYYDATSYLNTGHYWWSMTPLAFKVSDNMFVGLGLNGFLDDDSASYVYGVRPSVSLRAGTRVSGGTGIVDDPYIVE